MNSASDHILATGHRLSRTPPLLSAVAQVLFGLSVLGMMALLFFLGVLLQAPIVSFLMVFVGLPALVSIYWITTLLRRAQSRQVLMYLEQGVRQGFALPEYLESGARSESILLSMRLGSLANALRSGIPLGVAVAQQVPEVPFRQACLIAAGESNGRLRETLSRILRQDLERSDVRDEHSTYYRTYCFMVVGSVIFLLMFMCVFVVPKYRNIFNDFKTSLPWLTEKVLDMTGFLVDTGIPWIVLVGLCLVLLMTLGSVVRRLVLPGWAPISDLRLLRRLSWYVPFWHQLEHHAGLADICETMAESAKAGMPADKIFEQAGALSLNPVLQDRVHRWRELARSGAPLAEAARKAGFPAMVSGILATARGDDGLARALEFLGQSYRTRFSRVTILIQGIGQPMLILLLGLVVGTFVLAFFLPLVKLIASVSGYPEYL